MGVAEKGLSAPMLPEELLKEREINRVGPSEETRKQKQGCRSREGSYHRPAHGALPVGMQPDPSFNTDVEEWVRRSLDERRKEVSGTLSVMPDVEEGDESLISLPFDPIVLTFHDVCYSVDMPAVSDHFGEFFLWGNMGLARRGSAIAFQLAKYE